MQTTTVTITVEVPTLWWDFLLLTRTPEEARTEFLRVGGLPRDWRDMLARHHAARTGHSMVEHREAVDVAADSELEKLAAQPDKPKPKPEPEPEPAPVTE